MIKKRDLGNGDKISVVTRWRELLPADDRIQRSTLEEIVSNSDIDCIRLLTSILNEYLNEMWWDGVTSSPAHYDLERLSRAASWLLTICSSTEQMPPRLLCHVVSASIQLTYRKSDQGRGRPRNKKAWHAAVEYEGVIRAESGDAPSVSAVARTTGVTRPTVTGWRRREDYKAEILSFIDIVYGEEEAGRWWDEFNSD
jgi:hypothetical protein